jgi:hypothetical protein
LHNCKEEVLDTVFFSKILSREIYDVVEITTGLGDLGIGNVRVKT